MKLKPTCLVLLHFALMMQASEGFVIRKKLRVSTRTIKKYPNQTSCLQHDMISTISRSATSIMYDDKLATKEKEARTTLVPLSKSPLLLVSSKPLLSKEECRTVIKYLETVIKDGAKDPLNNVFFEQDGKYVFSTEHASKTNNRKDKDDINIEGTAIRIDQESGSDEDDAFYENARQLIFRVRSDIDKITNSPSHQGDFALPRFLSFKVETISDPSKDNVRQILGSLLPDGLHSDNVNDMFTRHISALVYLSDEVDECEKCGLVGGATTFPLAVPLVKKEGRRGEYYEEIELTDWDEKLINAARNLVSKNVLHTGSRRDGVESDCILLEGASYSLFHKEITSKGHWDDGDGVRSIGLPTSNLGIRVNPKPGQLCVFHNLLDDGTIDPLTFHAGEAILGRKNYQTNTGKKVLLAFFKTIPTSAVGDSSGELAEKSSQSRKWIMDEYY